MFCSDDDNGALLCRYHIVVPTDVSHAGHFVEARKASFLLYWLWTRTLCVCLWLSYINPIFYCCFCAFHLYWRRRCSRACARRTSSAWTSCASFCCLALLLFFTGLSITRERSAEGRPRRSAVPSVLRTVARFFHTFWSFFNAVPLYYCSKTKT